MKLLSTLFIALLLICQACSSDDEQVMTCENCSFNCVDITDPDVITNDCLDNWECQFNILPNSRIKIEESAGVSDGPNTVFQMRNSTKGSDLIADDEYTDILVFELNDEQTSFSAEGDELQLLNLHFNRICYCVERGFVPVTAGCIQGEKQRDGSWFIQGNIVVTYSYGDLDVKFDSRFTE